MTNRKDRHFGVGLLYSRSSLSGCVERGKQFDSIYTFHGATGRIHWLKGEYAYLAPNGAASLLRRLCIKFNWVGDRDLIEVQSLARYHTLIVPHAVALPAQAHEVLADWVKKGGYLFATGQTDLPAELLGLSEVKWYRPEGYSALHYNNHHAIFGYRGYTVGICQPSSGSEVLASAFEVNRQKEILEEGRGQPLGPGLIKTGRVLFIPLPVFETFGAMLQGHINFEDMRNLSQHRFTYLDWLGGILKEVLEESGWKHLWRVRVKPWGKYDGVVVLRHDVDSSTDMTYLDFERENQIPATYAILDDRRRQHWLKALPFHPTAEAAYHFDTGPNNATLYSSLLTKLRGANANVQKKTSRKGLWKQVKKARDELGIPIITAQRHNSFFTYPEIVDAMDYLYKKESEVLGLGTMFRFTNIMFGGEKKENGCTYVLRHPDTSVPFWFPFKLWYASTNFHYALRGWDITHVLEPEPWLIELLFSQEKYLEDGVYTVGFHPAHCWGKSFRQEGNWEWYKYAVELGRSQGYLFLTCKEVFERMNRWENLGFGMYGDEGWVENRHSSSSVTVCLEHCGAQLLFKEKKASIELLEPALTKITLELGDRVHFSLG